LFVFLISTKHNWGTLRSKIKAIAPVINGHKTATLTLYLYYLRRGGNVFVSVCVSVCLCVYVSMCKITEQVMNGFDEIFGGMGVA